MMNAILSIEVLGTIMQGKTVSASHRVGTRLSSGTLILGSCPSTMPNLMLLDETVSKNHAEIGLVNGTWKIRDLNSDNGLVFLESDIKMSSGFYSGNRQRSEEAEIIDLVAVALGAVVIRIMVGEV